MLAPYMFVTYFDESTGSKETTARFYVIAGLIAEPQEWAAFDSDWSAVLGSVGVATFHATDCQNGYREFKHLRGPANDATRRSIQEKFATVIADHRLRGVTVAITLVQHRHFQPRLPRAKGQEHMVVPHMVGFRAFVQFAAQGVEDSAPQESLSVVASDGPYAGRMRDLYNQIKRDIRASWVHRLSSFSSSAARSHSALQAADLLAYETWQMREHNKGVASQPLHTVTRGNRIKDYVLSRQFYQRIEHNTNNLLKTLNQNDRRPNSR